MPKKSRKAGVGSRAKTKSKPAGRNPRKTKRAAVKRSIPGEKLSLVVPRIAPGKVKIGKRFGRDFGDIDSVVSSINARGGLIQPIALTPKAELIAGERRLRAWKRSRFSADPIPYYVIDVDSVLAGEWDENAIRKDFTPQEAVEIQRALGANQQAFGIGGRPVHGASASSKKSRTAR